jgi:hypothetical protein
LTFSSELGLLVMPTVLAYCLSLAPWLRTCYFPVATLAGGMPHHITCPAMASLRLPSSYVAPPMHGLPLFLAYAWHGTYPRLIRLHFRVYTMHHKRWPLSITSCHCLVGFFLGVMIQLT